MLIWLTLLVLGEGEGGTPLPPDYYAPRNPTVRIGYTLSPAVTVAPTLDPTVTIIH
jgi:hypothetical protein